jgi:preprotein translocase subunit SecY
LIELLKPIVNILPEVETPKEKPHLKKRLQWTAFGLLVFAIMGVITPIGTLPMEQSGFLSQLQLITASQIGSLATLGIGPIVMASIILQLLVGAKVIKLNMQNPEEKKLFQGVQKVLGIAFCFLEGAIFVMSGFVPASAGSFSTIFLILQLAAGGILLMYLDEVISKYGIGSGVGLFIAAGVSFTIIWSSFSWVIPAGTDTYIGLVPQIMQGLVIGEIPETAIYTIMFTILIFLLVVFAESMKIEIPLTFGKIRGFGSRFPIKFFYVSNIPVILAAALFANIQLWGMALQGMGFPVLGTYVDNQPVSGLAYYLKTPFGLLATPTQTMITISNFDAIINILVYSAAMIILCVVFGKFWAEMSNMGPKAVAGQLQQVGLHIPGFRRDPRVVEMVLDRYIPTVTVLGSAAVGILAVVADLTGALGTGTGILLTVGILYRMYEELAAQQAFEAMPALKGLMGG